MSETIRKAWKFFLLHSKSCVVSSFSDSMLEIDIQTLWLFWVDFYATHGTKKQQLTLFLLIIKMFLLVFYGLVCDQLSRQLWAKGCISTTESRVARPYPSRLYNQKHLILPEFFSCSVETTLSGNGEIHLRGCHRESGWESQTISSKNLQGVFRATIWGLKKVARPKKQKRYRVKFFSANWLLQIDSAIL